MLLAVVLLVVVQLALVLLVMAVVLLSEVKMAMVLFVGHGAAGLGYYWSWYCMVVVLLAHDTVGRRTA